MPRFFFHLYDDMTVIDDTGVELPDMAAALREAIRNARSIAAEQVVDGLLHLNHRIEVEDEIGMPVLTLPFRDAFIIDS